MAVSVTRIQSGMDHPALVRRLVEFGMERPEADQVMTIYVNLDPREFSTPAARASEITSLLDQAAREAPNPGWNAAIDDLRGLFQSTDYQVDEARGLAIIRSIDGSLDEVFKLARPVERHVSFGETAHVLPLVASLPGPTWGVLLVNRRCARVLVGTADDLHQVAFIEDEVPGQHDQGGWSQANYQRSIENDMQEHLKRVADLMLRLVQSNPFDRLVIAAPTGVRAGLRQALHPYVADHLYDWFDADVENTTVDAVRRSLRPLFDRFEQEKLARLLERLREGAGSGGAVALGLDAVLEALNEQRVEHLVLLRGTSAPGAVCPSCQYKRAGEGEPGTCPADGTPMQASEDIVETAAEAAVLQSAHLTTAPADDSATALELRGFGGIAALLRF